MELSLPLILNIALSVTVIVLAVSLLRHKRKYQLDMEVLEKKVTFATDEKIQQLEKNISMISKGSLGVGRRLMHTEKKLNQTMERQHEMENRDTDQLSFNQAAKLLEKGIEVDEVVGKVGITRSEAELVKLFQKKELEALES